MVMSDCDWRESCKCIGRLNPASTHDFLNRRNRPTSTKCLPRYEVLAYRASQVPTAGGERTPASLSHLALHVIATRPRAGQPSGCNSAY